MNSREAILKALRKQKLVPEPLPTLQGPFTRYPDATAEFTRALTRAAGTCVRLPEGASLRAELLALPCMRGSQSVCSLAPQLAGNVSLEQNAHAYRNVDVLIARASIGVAENGALWFTDATTRQRSVYFLAQHMVALLDPCEIVHNLHEAYQRITVAQRPFGCFIAGPSKTADIEQALVVGAHGPRSLTVVLA